MFNHFAYLHDLHPYSKFFLNSDVESSQTLFDELDISVINLHYNDKILIDKNILWQGSLECLKDEQNDKVLVSSLRFHTLLQSVFQLDTNVTISGQETSYNTVEFLRSM